jgi:hypothetical protein
MSPSRGLARMRVAIATPRSPSCNEPVCTSQPAVERVAGGRTAVGSDDHHDGAVRPVALLVENRARIEAAVELVQLHRRSTPTWTTDMPAATPAPVNAARLNSKDGRPFSSAAAPSLTSHYRPMAPPTGSATAREEACRLLDRRKPSLG